MIRYDGLCIRSMDDEDVVGLCTCIAFSLTLSHSLPPPLSTLLLALLPQFTF